MTSCDHHETFRLNFFWATMKLIYSNQQSIIEGNFNNKRLDLLYIVVPLSTHQLCKAFEVTLVDAQQGMLMIYILIQHALGSKML